MYQIPTDAELWQHDLAFLKFFMHMGFLLIIGVFVVFFGILLFNALDALYDKFTAKLRKSNKQKRNNTVSDDVFYSDWIPWTGPQPTIGRGVQPIEVGEIPENQNHE